MYVICIDYNREKFTDDCQLNSVPYSLPFLNQLIQSAQLFQSCQINTIEHNLHYFQNLSRKFMKKLHQIKENTLQTFLHQCQIRPLLSTDRHLLNPHLQIKRIYPYNDRITRTGTFNNQHQIDSDAIRHKIQNGFFCLICTTDDLCKTCQILSRMIDNRSLSIEKIYIGQLIADKQIIIDRISGQPSRNIRNSCFCNRYLLELCEMNGIESVGKESLDEDLTDLQSIRHSSSTEIPIEQFEQLQRFARNYQINVSSEI